MSDFSLDDELVLEYLAESREHLATIENDLLAIEQAGAGIDEQLVNRVFRAAHSIKGGAGFFDLVRIRELAHKTENLLDLVRSRQLVPTSGLVSVLFLAFDKLRDLIDNYRESNAADISDFVRALTNAAVGEGDADTGSVPYASPASAAGALSLTEPDAILLGRASAFDVGQARRQGKSVFIIECDLIHDVERRGRTPLALLQAMMGCGSVLDTGFDTASCGTLDDAIVNRLILEILYATAVDVASLAQVFEIPVRQIRRIEDNRCVPGPPEEGIAGTEPAPAMPAAQSSLPAPPTPVPVAAAVAPGELVAKTLPARPVERPAVAEPGQKASSTGRAEPEATIRLNVSLLDSLMTLAGELVLSRNQLHEAVAGANIRAIGAGAHRISAVTSELQEAVALTRMQPVGSLFGKFPRLVRDLAQALGKQVELRMEGADVEIDKNLLEGLSDPLTHMVRNSVDHGIETPEARRASGKPPGGTVTLRARHQAGQVVIEIRDDGKGLAAEKIAASALAKGQITAEQLASMAEREKFALIFHPGVSTAETVSDVSGRGVGMDVVKTNLDRLGGKIEIDSSVGNGAVFRIRLPLTLAIIPSLMISEAGERFAIPQTSVSELIRIPAGQRGSRIDRAADAELLLLRDRLVPLLHLSRALADSRCSGAGERSEAVGPETGNRHESDRKEVAPAAADAAMNIVLVDAGSFEYGLVVQKLHDTVEIVVKPLGRHLQGLRDYAGATILGDGRVAAILDVAGLAARAGLNAGSAAARQATPGHAHREIFSGADSPGISNDDDTSRHHSLLLFHNAPGERCALPTESVTRIEQVRPVEIEMLAGRRTMKYRGASLPLVCLGDLAHVGELARVQQWVVMVIERAGRPFGLLAAEPLDMVDAHLALDPVTLRQNGIAGSAILNGATTLVLDIFELAGTVFRDDATPPGEAHYNSRGSARHDAPASGPAGGEARPVPVKGDLESSQPTLGAPTVLVAEDSDFFRGQIIRLIEAVGYRVLAAADGEAAWEILDRHPGRISVVATDVEMPRLDGLGLTRRIRGDARFHSLPVIALSSLAGEEEIARGIECGVSEYQVKFDREQLLESIRRAIEAEACTVG